MARLTDKYDVPQMVFIALFYADLCVGAGMAFRIGREWMGAMVGW